MHACLIPLTFSLLLAAGSASPPSTGPASARQHPLAALPPLPVKPERVEQLRSAAPARSEILLTPHFAISHTTSAMTARHVARRLEAVYAANVRFAQDLRLAVTRPAHKLEVVLVDTFDAFTALREQADPSSPDQTLGYYDPRAGRSVFFDLRRHPEVQSVYEHLASQPRTAVTAWHRARVERRVDRLEAMVIQHEAAHHVHAELGIVASDAPPWLAEGMAQLFELPHLDVGVSPAFRTNGHRLREYVTLHARRSDLGNRIRRLVKGERLLEGDDYSLAWALTSYLYIRRREDFATYLRGLRTADRDAATAPAADTPLTRVFGPMNEAFTAGFRAHMRSLAERTFPARNRPAALPHDSK